LLTLTQVVLPAIALAIAIMNALGRKDAPLWLAVAILAACPLLLRLLI
jgi:hypothetical protein